MKSAEQFLREKGKERYFDPNGYCEFDSLVKLLDEYADQVKPKWISVSDELPKPYESVLIFSGSQVKFGWKQDQEYYKRRIPIDKFTSSIGEVRNVTHWMPLPEKPQDNG